MSLESSIAQKVLPGMVRSRWNEFSTKIKADAAKRNFGIWAQWVGILSGVLAIILGITNFIDVLHILIFIFAALSIVSGILVFLVEWHILRKMFFGCFRVPQSWEAHIAGVHGYQKRAAVYAVLAAIQFASIAVNSTSLITVAALFTILAALNLAAWKQNGNNFTGSEALGGEGDAQRLDDDLYPGATPRGTPGRMFPDNTPRTTPEQMYPSPRATPGQTHTSNSSPYAQDNTELMPDSTPRIEPDQPPRY